MRQAETRTEPAFGAVKDAEERDVTNPEGLAEPAGSATVGRRSRMRRLMGSLILWRTTAALAGVALCAAAFCIGPGSIQIVRVVPAGATSTLLSTPESATTVALPSWTRPCFGQVPDVNQSPLAFCARVDGRVIARYTKPGDRETHILVTGGFHVTLVELRPGASVPALGSRVVAVGPLAGDAEYGFREMKAVKVNG